MLPRRLHVTVLASVLGTVLVADAARAQQMFFYPQKGQNAQQQQTDQGECYGWAMQQTGYNPTASAQAAPPPPPQSGGAVGGAARGAAVGAIGGAIGGNAGKGAAIGAAAGGTFGAMKRNNQNKAYSQEVAAQQSQTAQQQANFNRAVAACMSGRGYTVQ